MLLTELNLYWTQNTPLNASVPLNVSLESLFRCCSSAHSHPAFTGLEVFELRRGKQHMHRCRSSERSRGERTVRVLFSLLVPLFLGSSSRSIRALSRRAVCINSPAFMWTPSLSSSLHLTNGCGFHIDKHRYSLEYHYFVLCFLCTFVPR